MTTALLPNDGLPLPFVSYGGTSLIFSLAAVGMLVGIHRRSQIAVAEAFPLATKDRILIRVGANQMLLCRLRMDAVEFFEPVNLTIPTRNEKG